MEDFKSRAEFRNLLRTQLTPLLNNYGYELIYDNEIHGKDMSKWVFKLIYSGYKTFQIYNVDWRDYTEYFKVELDGKELFILNLNDFKNIETAYNDLVDKTIDCL